VHTPTHRLTEYPPSLTNRKTDIARTYVYRWFLGSDSSHMTSLTWRHWLKIVLRTTDDWLKEGNLLITVAWYYLIAWGATVLKSNSQPLNSIRLLRYFRRLPIIRMDKLYSGLSEQLHLNYSARWTPKGQMWQIVPCRIPKQNVWDRFLFSTKTFPEQLGWVACERPEFAASFLKSVWSKIQQNLVTSFVIDCFMGAHDSFTK